MNYPHPFVYLFNLALAHPFWAGVCGYWLYSAAVDNLPAPNGNNFYRWLYGFLHTIAGNLSLAFASKMPGVASASADHIAPSPPAPAAPTKS